MKFFWSLSLAILSSFFLAFTWPGENKKPKDLPKEALKQEISDPIPASNNLPNPSVSKIHDIKDPKTQKPIGSVMVPPVIPTAASIPVAPEVTPIALQQQLKDLMRVNSLLKTSSAAQATEIERLRQEATLHQRILKGADLRNLPKSVATVPVVQKIPTAVPSNSENDSNQ